MAFLKGLLKAAVPTTACTFFIAGTALLGNQRQGTIHTGLVRQYRCPSRSAIIGLCCSSILLSGSWQCAFGARTIHIRQCSRNSSGFDRCRHPWYSVSTA